MLPFKSFHCGKFGHFSSKFPFKQNNINKRKGKDKPKEKNSYKRNIFYSKEDNISSLDTAEEEYEPNTNIDQKILMDME
jgi:hypothetical protein